MVSRRVLIGIAGLVWILAGSFVLSTGVSHFSNNTTIFVCLLSILIFVLFSALFQMLAYKNQKRIRALESDKNPVFKFFTVQSYIVVAFMITLGIVLRLFLPSFFIAFFYTGLGSALFLAGIAYLGYYIQYLLHQ